MLGRHLQKEVVPARSRSKNAPVDQSEFNSSQKASGHTVFRKALCVCGGGCPSCQSKSSSNISQPNDPAEIEADRIADKVMRMPASETGGTLRKSIASADAAFGHIHRKPLSTKSPSKSHSPAHVQSAIGSGGQPLDRSTRNFFEPRLGYDLSSVRIHTGSTAENSARAINARAYAIGDDIVFGSGEYAPNSDSGRHLLAHELAHVAQAGKSVLNRQTIYRQPAGSGGDIAAIEAEIQMLSQQMGFYGPADAAIGMQIQQLEQRRRQLLAGGAGHHAPAPTKPNPAKEATLSLPFEFRFGQAWGKAKEKELDKVYKDAKANDDSSIRRRLIEVGDVAPGPREVWKAGIYGGLFRNDEQSQVEARANELARESFDRRYKAAKYGQYYGEENRVSGEIKRDDATTWNRGRHYGLFLAGEKARVMNISAIGIGRAAAINAMAAQADPKSPNAAALIDEIHEFTKNDAVILLGPEIERLLGPFGYTYSDETDRYYVADKINKAFAKYVPPGQILGNPNATVTQRWDECQRRHGFGKNNLEAAKYDPACFKSHDEFTQEYNNRQQQARKEYDACDEMKGIKAPKLTRTHPEWIGCQNDVFAEYYPNGYAQLDADRTAVYQDMQVGMPAVTDQGFASALAFHVAHEWLGWSTQDSANAAAITSTVTGIARVKIQKVFASRNSGQSLAPVQGMTPPPSNVAQAPKREPMPAPDRAGSTPTASAPAAPANDPWAGTFSRPVDVSQNLRNQPVPLRPPRPAGPQVENRRGGTGYNPDVSSSGPVTPTPSTPSPPANFREALDRVDMTRVPARRETELRQIYRQDYSKRPKAEQRLHTEDDYVRFRIGVETGQLQKPAGNADLASELGRAHEQEWAKVSGSPRNPGVNNGGRFKTPYGNVEPDFAPSVADKKQVYTTAPGTLSLTDSDRKWAAALRKDWRPLLVADSKHIGTTGGGSITHGIDDQIRGFIWLASFSESRTFVIVGQKGDRISKGVHEFAKGLGVKVELAPL